MTLDELIEASQSSGRWKSAWVNCDGFKGMYVRVSKRYINKEYFDVIDLANIEAEHPGNGAFRSLISHLTKTWPQYTIHVENALTEKFQVGLLRMGFKETGIPMCFYLPSASESHLAK